jgi:hypothetical protein
MDESLKAVLIHRDLQGLTTSPPAPPPRYLADTALQHVTKRNKHARQQATHAQRVTTAA